MLHTGRIRFGDQTFVNNSTFIVDGRPEPKEVQYALLKIYIHINHINVVLHTRFFYEYSSAYWGTVSTLLGTHTLNNFTIIVLFVVIYLDQFMYYYYYYFIQYFVLYSLTINVHVKVTYN